MKRTTLVYRVFLSLIIWVYCISLNAQSKEGIKRIAISDFWSSAFCIEEYNGDYIVAGLTTFTEKNSVYLFAVLIDKSGNVLQFDTIPETEYIIALNRNNDMFIEGHKAYFNSTGSGTFILYSYDIIKNQIETEKVILTYQYDFDGIECFVQEGKKTKDDQYSNYQQPSGLFVNDLSKLTQMENHRSDKWGVSGMVYWSDRSLIKKANLSDIYKYIKTHQK